MKKFAAFAFIILTAACAPQSEAPVEPKALSCEARDGGAVSVGSAWLREQKDETAMSAGYFTLCNGTMAPIILTGLSTPAAGMVELHETTRDDAGVISMGPTGEITLQPGERVVFAPGGKHAMLMGLTAPISSGDEAIFRFEFADGSTLEATATVKSAVEAASE